MKYDNQARKENGSFLSNCKNNFLSYALSSGKSTSLSKPLIKRDDTAFLQYTGGTTGVSKGAVYSHGNIITNVLQAKAWIQFLIRDGEEIIITPLPLYHIFLLTANCLIFNSVGGLNVLITNPRDIPGFVLRRNEKMEIHGLYRSEYAFQCFSE